MKVALLDRDGTVIVDPPDLRVDKMEKIELFDDSISALKYLADNDFSVIYATNQAGIEEEAGSHGRAGLGSNGRSIAIPHPMSRCGPTKRGCTGRSGGPRRGEPPSVDRVGARAPFRRRPGLAGNLTCPLARAGSKRGHDATCHERRL